MTQFRLQKASALGDPASRESALNKLFSIRFTTEGRENCYDLACELLENSRTAIGDKDTYGLKGLLDYFFFEDVRSSTWRAALEGIEFKDFSLANIFYSASAALNGYSMRLAGKDMAAVLGIRDNVHLISDVNLYLEARTESGRVIGDEGLIVKWDNPDDKIASVMLLRDGQEYIPAVDEGTDVAKVPSCRDTIEKADIIIFSSGTQWSSLVPSYMHSGLRKILAASGARKYVVMNNVEDHDMKGVSADGIVDIIGQNIPVDDITAVVNLDAVPGLDRVGRIRSISGHISGEEKAKHDPVKLVSLIMKDYFGVAGFKGTMIYDLDGTLWDERANNRGKAVGAENMNLFRGIIHSGNSREHVRDVFRYLYHQDALTDIYSDFGNVHFNSGDYAEDILNEGYVVDPAVVTELEKIPAFKGKVLVRGGGCVVTVKPLVNRAALLAKAQEALEAFGGKYEARISGHTSIDIMARGYGKKAMLREILERHHLKADEVLFVGNETEQGAEANIKETGVRVLQVDDVYECNVFLRTVNA